jgi:hypothetical protein
MKDQHIVLLFASLMILSGIAGVLISTRAIGPKSLGLVGGFTVLYTGLRLYDILRR